MVNKTGGFWYPEYFENLKRYARLTFINSTDKQYRFNKPKKMIMLDKILNIASDIKKISVILRRYSQNVLL